MKFQLTALFDDETRKQIQEAVLGEARSIARNLIGDEVRAEIARVIAAFRARGSESTLHNMFVEALRQEVSKNWTTIGAKLDRMIEEKMIKAFDGKMDKLGQGQADAVRALVRKELRNILSVAERV